MFYRGDRVSRTQDMKTFLSGGQWKLSGVGSCACRGVSASMGARSQLAAECVLTSLNSGKKNFTIWK